MSAKKSLEQTLSRIIDLAEEVAQPLGLQVVDVRLAQQGKVRSLEVTIYKPGLAVSLTDCEQVSRQLDQRLEASAQAGQPYIEGAYLLEVQSPGIERPLKTQREYNIFSGQRVLVSARRPVDGLGAQFIAFLQEGTVGGAITFIKAEPAHPPKGQNTVLPQVTVEYSNLSQVKLHPEHLFKSKGDS